MNDATTRRVILYLRLRVAKDEYISIAKLNKQLQAPVGREGWQIGETLTDDYFIGGKPRANAEKALLMLCEGAATSSLHTSSTDGSA